MKEKAIICDIDGTIAIKGNRNPFDWQRVDEDMPNSPVITLVKILQEAGKTIIFVSGRKEECRQKTIEWVNAQGIQIKDLFMRGDNDNRSDVLLKSEIYNIKIKDNYDIEFVLDDRDQVVQMWRKIGLTCLQVAEGDF